MLEHAVIIVVILLFVAFSIPIVQGMWDLFSVRKLLEEKIKENSHRLDLIEKDGKYLIDQQALAINGLKEMVGHVRTRSAREEEKLEERVTDLERFLAKTADFTARRQ